MSEPIIMPPDELQLKAAFAKKISKVMAAVSHVEKNGRNEHHKYDYAKEGDVLDALRAPLIEQGLVILPCIRDFSQTGQISQVSMEFEIVDTDTGYSVVRPWVGLGQDQQDKGANKAATGATKYFLLKLFHLTTGDDSDGDGPAPKAKAKPAPKLGSQKIAGDWLTKVLGMDAKAFNDFKTFATGKGRAWEDAALEAQEAGCKDAKQLYAYLEDGQQPT